MAGELPPGFTLDTAEAPDLRQPPPNAQQQGLPPGFTLDTSTEESPGIIERITNTVVGQNEFPDLKEFRFAFPDEATEHPSLGQGGSMRLTDLGQRLNQIDFARSPLAKADKISELFPGTTFDSDKFGNIIVNFSPELKEASGQERAVINASGLSKQDFADLGMDAVFEGPLVGPAGRVGQVVSPVGKFVGRTVGAGVGIGTGAVARDAVSGTGIDLNNAANAAIFGGLGQGAAEVLFGAFGRMARGLKGNKLSANDKAILEKLDIDPELVTPEFLKQFRKSTNRSANPEAAALDAAAESLPGDTPILTTGQLTDDPFQLSLESQIKEQGNQLGPNPLLAAQNQAQDALRDNVTAIQKQLGRSEITTADEGAVLIADRVRKAEAKARKDNRELFTTAKEQGQRAFIPTDQLTDLVPAIRKTIVSDEATPLHIVPRTSALIKELSQVTGREEGLRITAANVNFLENIRKRANKIIRTTTDVPEKIAASKLIAHYDQFVRDAIDNSSDSALDAWKKATRNHKAFVKRFRQKDVVGDLVETVNGEARFKVGPDEAVDKIFGRGKLGTQKDLANDFSKLKAVLGEDSVEWQAVREATWLRLFKTQAADALQPGSRQLFSGAKFSTELTELLKKPAAMKELFTPKEAELFRRFRTVALAAERDANKIIAGRANRSGTATGLLAQRFIDRANTSFGVFGKFIAITAQAALRKIEPSILTQAGRVAAQGTLPRRPPVSPIVTTPFGVTAGTTAGQNDLLDQVTDEF